MSKKDLCEFLYRHVQTMDFVEIGVICDVAVCAFLKCEIWCFHKVYSVRHYEVKVI